jgi:colanic acid/amylovoran biosynthesis protein
MINLYYHGGSKNHGCEAIVRSTSKLLGSKAILWSTAPEADYDYSLNDVVSIQEDEAVPLTGLESLKFKIHHKVTKSDLLHTKFSHKRFFSAVQSGDIYLSIGGDNYCYAGKDILGHYNQIIHEKGGKTVFWGCSFEPSEMDAATAKDIARYDLITARESISYETLKAVNPNTILVADPAFVLDSVELPLPEGWKEGDTIGINASPLIMQCAKDGSVAYEAYRRLIEHILDTTDATIALIPHVVIKNNDDRIPLHNLYEKFASTGRVLLIEDHNCCELKGYISRCRMFIGARTHATIAAYSTCVPTLVLGYSVKSKGIARDIFGTEEHYVLPVQELQDPDELANGFDWLSANETTVRDHLIKTMPKYKARALLARDAVEELVCR